MESQGIVLQAVFICSDHPIAYQLIHEIIAGDRSLHCGLERYVKSAVRRSEPDSLLILDCCAGDQWPDIAIRWNREGGTTVCIVPGKPVDDSEQRAFYLGASGIVCVSPVIHTELLQAVHAVLEGRMWYRSSFLTEQVKQGQARLIRRSSLGHALTIREEQVVSFVVHRFGNKQIADALGISERTVKFHMSNILQKMQANNRKELANAMSRKGVDSRAIAS